MNSTLGNKIIWFTESIRKKVKEWERKSYLSSGVRYFDLVFFGRVFYFFSFLSKKYRVSKCIDIVTHIWLFFACRELSVVSRLLLFPFWLFLANGFSSGVMAYLFKVMVFLVESMGSGQSSCHLMTLDLRSPEQKLLLLTLMNDSMNHNDLVFPHSAALLRSQQLLLSGWSWINVIFYYAVFSSLFQLLNADFWGVFFLLF